ncbi:acyltransferase [Melaminivora sp.]|uniref:acyltransferase family protein n=1 Tax=Melaminivora sp. TaxID=1933032 RepID=UPI0028A5E0E7|nr:acyltransferase [Melaminivora sp.]
MYLNQLLQRQNNNFDLIRLIAACMVIYGHAPAMLPAGQEGDFVARWLTFDYSGSLAVKIFFFLSGLVVTNSLLQKRSVTQFVLARVFRIWPALIVVVLVCALVLGPWLTNLPWSTYFQSSGVWSYVRGNLTMHPHYELPGVFVGQVSQVINGSLWSIPYEVDAYIVLIALFALGLHHYRLIATLVVALIILDPLTGNQLIFTWRPRQLSIDSLAPCFAFGALLALWKDKIHINATPAVGAFILFLAFKQSAHAPYLLYAALFLGLLYLCSLPAVLALRLPVDASYGIYLWGWPVQQVLALNFPQQGLLFHRASAMLLAALLGVLSWYLIEKPAIRLGQRLHGVLLRSRPGSGSVEVQVQNSLSKEVGSA